jgi:hypothetical protein
MGLMLFYLSVVLLDFGLIAGDVFVELIAFPFEALIFLHGFEVTAVVVA